MTRHLCLRRKNRSFTNPNVVLKAHLSETTPPHRKLIQKNSTQSAVGQKKNYLGLEPRTAVERAATTRVYSALFVV